MPLTVIIEAQLAGRWGESILVIKKHNEITSVSVRDEPLQNVKVKTDESKFWAIMTAECVDEVLKCDKIKCDVILSQQTPKIKE